MGIDVFIGHHADDGDYFFARKMPRKAFGRALDPVRIVRAVRNKNRMLPQKLKPARPFYDGKAVADRLRGDLKFPRKYGERG